MRYILAFLVVVVLIFSLLLLLFHGGSKPPKVSRSLGSYADTDAIASLTIDGPVNTDLIHQSVQISVGQDEVTYEQIQGYQGTVVNQQSFASNSNAYANFLLALQHAGFRLGDNNPLYKDDRGYCPLGDRYIFEFIDQGQQLERYWATSCGKPSTYRGNTSLTLSLFKAQVPNYNMLTSSLDL
ncbi:MAG TPA: hypothetical protein VLF79_01110 [Candidatus Saccharimonadales bacterium]|nr:hypothetical protein [Candidatus Saccharimonadales bacterium]